jgi:uncharacterized protein YggU (UPF0235/DUF167 family)
MYVKMRATPDAKKEKVTKHADGEFSIEVREPAARNCANTRIREIVATLHDVPLGKVRMVSGHRSPSKIMSIG